MSSNEHDELIDYEDDQDGLANGATVAVANGGSAVGDGGDKTKQKNFSGIHSTGFR